MAEAADGENTGASGGAGGAPRLADMAGARDHDLFTSTDEPELEFDTEIGTDLLADKEVELWDNSADDVGSEDSTAELDEKLDEGDEEEDDDDVHNYTARLPSLPWDFELAKDGEGGAFRGGAITPEGLIDEDFERELGMPGDGGTVATRSEFHDIEKLGIVDVAGDDMYGRKVIVVSACKLPPSQTIDHQRLLAYIKVTLDRFVAQDYVLVYFHYGLNSRNRPKLRFLLQAYKELNRQYKKNLKTLYLVHPTNFIKVLWNIFRPFISVKFGKKLVYVNYLVELKSQVHMDQLPVPKDVLEFDLKKCTANKPQYPYTTATPTCKRQQFGLSLARLRERDNQQIPIVVEETIRYLREHNGVEVEGIFRRCANVNTVKAVQEKYNAGVPVNYADYPDMHVPAAILKKFLRELEEPLMTFELFEPVTRVQYFTDETLQTEEVRRIVVHELPEDNYVILKFIIKFLIEVTENCEVNKMTPENIATVFGPNLAWSKGVDNLNTVEPVIKFTQLLIQQFDTLFVR